MAIQFSLTPCGPTLFLAHGCLLCSWHTVASNSMHGCYFSIRYLLSFWHPVANFTHTITILFFFQCGTSLSGTQLPILCTQLLSQFLFFFIWYLFLAHSCRFHAPSCYPLYGTLLKICSLFPSSAIIRLPTLPVNQKNNSSHLT